MPRPFTGPQLWNPYARGSGTWLRANFHAHGRAWGGLTNGAQGDAEVAAAYRANGYDIVGISDYQHIADPSLGTIPVYEHGFNVGKHHQLAIGAREVDWFDFPLWQGVNQKQYIIERISRSSELVAINHPSRLHSYTVEDVTALTGYDLIELANGRVTTEDRWDAALSSGHPVWGIGGDDSHDVTDEGRMAIAWNMIDASASGVIDALRAGRSYTVVRTVDEKTAGDLRIVDVHVENGILTVTGEGAPATFVFVGQGGAIRKTVGEAAGVTSASYEFTEGDTYIRTVVHSPKTDLFLNPILRTGGDERLAPPRPAAVADATWTTAARAAIVAACALVVWLLF